MIVVQLFLAIAICALFIRFVNGNKRLPPGPLRLPILGSAIQLHLAHPTAPHLALSKLAAKYGDIFSFGFGSQLAVSLSSYEAVREIFKLDDSNRDRYIIPCIEDRNYGKSLGIIFGSGRSWLEVRTFTKKVMREFGYGKVKIMDKALIDGANQLVDSVKTMLLDTNDGILTVKTSIFSVHVLNVLWTTIGGYQFDPNDEIFVRNMHCLDKAVQVYGNKNLYNVFPFLRKWFPKLVDYPEHLKIHEEIHGFTKFLIADAKDRRSQRLDSEATSFIEVFLDKIDENHNSPDTIYNEEQLEIIMEDLLLGGLETTGTLLNWSILFMVLNPDIQNKVRQVILANTTDKIPLLSAMELKRIPFVKATVLEIFRCGNVAPTPVPRLATGEIKFRNYVIPKGTVLFSNMDPIYSDTKFWKDPETFRPERFLDENGEIDLSVSEKITGTVFGVGPRTCFGENVGLDSMYTYFAALMVSFRFDAVPGQEPSAENYTSNLTKYPHDYIVKVTKLSS